MLFMEIMEVVCEKRWKQTNFWIKYRVLHVTAGGTFTIGLEKADPPCYKNARRIFNPTTRQR